MSPTSNSGKPSEASGRAGGMGSRLGTAGDVLRRWIWKDLFASEVHHVPSLGPFSLQVLQLGPWLPQGRANCGGCI